MRFLILKKPVAQKSILYICVSFSVSVGEGEDDVFRENSMYIIYSETDHQLSWMQETSIWGWCTGKTQRDGEYM